MSWHALGYSNKAPIVVEVVVTIKAIVVVVANKEQTPVN